MKPIQYIAYTALCSLLLAATGCQKEDLTKQLDSSTFTIQITGDGSASVLTRAEVIEKVTTPLHLFVYKAGVADDAAPVCYKKDELTDAVAKVVKCTLPPSVLVSDKYDIYVVGIADSEASGITDQTTKSQLLALTQTNIAEITSKTKTYMLAGVTSNTTLDALPTVQIVRNVCRLDLTLTDESGNAFTAIEATLSAPDRTFLFSSALRGSGLDNTFPVGTLNKEQVFTLNTATTPDNFDGSVFFFEKMTTVAGVKTEADRVKLAFKATNTTTGETLRYVTYINADADYITTRNTIYEVHGTIKEGTIIIKTEKLPWGEVVQTEEKPDPIIIQPKANCYLVPPGGNAILIPVAQANDAIAASIVDGEVLTAEMVWTDVKGAKTGKGLETDAAVAAIEVLGSGPEAVLMVTPGSELGNAVIAVKGTAGVIKWSWHIWVTDYDPEQNIAQETGESRNAPYIFMDRNLGAKSIVPSITGVDIIGTYYQFGRKDPFPTKGASTAFVTVYNAAGTAVARGSGATSAEVQIRNPYTWGTSGLPIGLDLWGEGGNKTVNDPCPPGWRVPSNSAFIDLDDFLLPKDAISAGRQGVAGYFPFTWMVHGNSTFWNNHLVANWTSTPSGTANGIMLRCDTNLSVDGNYAWGRTYGNTVRCVRDLGDEKAEKEVRVLSVGIYIPSLAHKSGNTAASTTYNEGYAKFLSINFGQGKPVDVFFKHYAHYNNGANTDQGLDYDIIDLLTKNKIDVLHLPWNGSATPTVAQAKAIVQWLEADPHRFLLMSPDLMPSLKTLQAELGFTKSHTAQVGDNAVLTNRTDSDIYNTLVTAGRYGKITNSTFKPPINWGWLNRDEVEANGYVPILEHTGKPNQIVMAVHPTKRVAILTETGYGSVTYGALNANGSLEATAKGDYPILVANMWAWIVETVKGR